MTKAEKRELKRQKGNLKEAMELVTIPIDRKTLPIVEVQEEVKAEVQEEVKAEAQVETQVEAQEEVKAEAQVETQVEAQEEAPTVAEETEQRENIFLSKSFGNKGMRREIDWFSETGDVIGGWITAPNGTTELTKVFSSDSSMDSNQKALLWVLTGKILESEEDKLKAGLKTATRGITNMIKAGMSHKVNTKLDLIPPYIFSACKAIIKFASKKYNI